MKVLLLTALACLVSAAEEPLLPSGDFNTIYLASKHVSVTKENSQFRILMREVKFVKNYKLMTMTFYVRKDGKCQIHTVRAVKHQAMDCVKTWYEPSVKCSKYNGTKNIIGHWTLRDAHLHFPKIYYFPAPQGGLQKTRGTNVTAEVWEEYVKLISQKKIPVENIENVYEADTCPKLKHGSHE